MQSREAQDSSLHFWEEAAPPNAGLPYTCGTWQPKRLPHKRGEEQPQKSRPLPEKRLGGTSQKKRKLYLPAANFQYFFGSSFTM